MRRLTLTALMLLVMFSGSLFAQDRTVAYIDQVTGGSASFTNETTSAAYRLDNVSFAIADATFTNTFSIRDKMRYKLPDIKVTSITTNTQITAGWCGYIETNTQTYAQGYTEYTNTWTATATTNDASTQFYDADDFYSGRSREWGDIQEFVFTYTNTINLKRVYTIHARP